MGCISVIVKNVRSGFQCSLQTRVYCPLNHFGMFSCATSSVRNPMQHFRSLCILRFCRSYLPLDHKRNQAGLGPEIWMATVLDHDDHSKLNYQVSHNLRPKMEKMRSRRGYIFSRNRQQCCHVSTYTQVGICCFPGLKYPCLQYGWK